jgi:hypothetical protein
VCPTYCSYFRLDAPKSVVDNVFVAQELECCRVVSERKAQHFSARRSGVLVWWRGECGEGKRKPTKLVYAR